MDVSPPDAPLRRELVVPIALAAATFAGLYLVAMLRAYTLAGGYDLAYFTQAAWLITEGEAPFVTIRGLHLLGDHTYPIFWPMAWLTGVLPTIPTLLAMQSASLAAGIVPLWRIGRRLAGLGLPATVALVVSYAAFPALHNVNLADFHPEVLAVPFLFGAVLLALTDRWVGYAACIVAVLACREDLSLVVTFLGVLLVVQGRRRAGLLTVVAGLTWLVVATQVIQPHFAGSFVHVAFLDRYGSSVGEIAATMAGDPGRVLGDLFTAQNGAFVVALLGPVAFLPLLAPRYLIPIVPLEILYLLSSREVAHTIEGQYTVSAIPFVFVATAMAVPRLARLVERAPAAARAPVVVRWGPAMVLIVTAVVGHTVFANDSVTERPWSWRIRDQVDQARLAAADLIPDDAAVSATDRVWPLIAERRAVHNFPGPWGGDLPAADPVPLDARRRAVEYIFVDTVDQAQWTGDRAAALEQLRAELGTRLIFDRDGILLYRLPDIPKAPPARGSPPRATE